MPQRYVIFYLTEKQNAIKMLFFVVELPEIPVKQD